MLKKRIIGLVLVKSGLAVQSIGFQRYLPIGKPEVAIHYLDRWGIDEIVVLHLDATANQQTISAEQVTSYAKQCQVPLSIGGGITQIDDIKRIIRAGADKVVINTGLFTAPNIITQGSELFGQQSIVASIDACLLASYPSASVSECTRLEEDYKYQTFTHGGKQSTGFSVAELAQQAQQLGAGEILITSIDNDGNKQGYDLTLIREAVEAVTIPVIACGGAGHPEHIRMALQTGAAAVAIGNYFHFSEHSVTLAKRYLQNKKQAIRLDSYFTYQNTEFDQQGRIIKQADAVLDALRFQYIPEEVI